MIPTLEAQRLNEQAQGQAAWLRWGPYLSERAWGTVREDYSSGGNAWDFLPHDHARSRAYRWGEDGLAGISDDRQYLCFALALWNGHDPILKERLFGLNGGEGNHGEDVKEVYFYVDSTPTHSYMKMVYKYPQSAFPYEALVTENGRRGRADAEFELLDTGIFDDNRYFDVIVEYAKAGTDDLLIQITVANRGDVAAGLTVLPTLWLRNTWSWGYPAGPMNDVPEQPSLHAIVGQATGQAIAVQHPVLERYTLYLDGVDRLIFTENETNAERLYGVPNASPYVKDAFHRHLIEGAGEAINPAQHGTKAAGVYPLDVAAGESITLRLRLTANEHPAPFTDFADIVASRLAEADAFYAGIQRAGM
ncbi:MAG: glucosidase, partial [Armatimonadetes bacterium]|nr:glucosidase [Anaerolineae bacterium]